ncbi:MAG: CoA transferase [Bifidobacteriaceae bacterium]|jgi:crotonobetainyl-CoA:carnitine CoA-transferase CaiB-like acyl-CoA transferase|nr:CoA transferase [Bifidobacteriaceae bacterium]
MGGLQGIKVIDLTQYVAGPACPRLLGELGATVYKVEPFTGDEQRTQGASWGMNHKTEFDDAAFDMSSMNKQWLAINLKSPGGRAVMEKLLAESDVFVTSFRDGALGRLGLDYDSIKTRFPHIVWAQMRGYGERGKEKDSRGFDATAYSARGGLAMSFPQANEHFQPGNPPFAVGDWNASQMLASGVLAALVRRLRTGQGDKVTVNLYHAACWAMTSAIVSGQQGAKYPKDRRKAPCPTNNCYQSGDGVWFNMCFGHYNKYFELVMTTIGLDHLVGNKDYDTLEVIGPSGANAQVIAWMDEAFAKQDFAHWERLFKERDIPFQKCFTVDDILEDDEAFDNDILRKIHYDDLGEYTVTTTPVRLASVGDPVLYRSRPIGYDTRAVLSGHGYSDADIHSLGEQGAVLCYSGPPVPKSVLAPSHGPGFPKA